MNTYVSTYSRIVEIGLSILICSVVCGCGGGTSGSGLSSFEGRVVNDRGAALSDATITIESTGDSTQSDENGAFSIRSRVGEGMVPFLIERGSFSSRFLVSDLDSEVGSEDIARDDDAGNVVSLNIEVDERTSEVNVEQLALRAGMVGECDYYFENNATIRQANQVPEGTLCTIKVITSRTTTNSNTIRAEKIPFALQRSRCEQNSPWHTIATAQTGFGVNAGVGQISFPFISSEEFCRYRIVAPFGSSGFRPLVVPLDTFAEQEFFGTKR